MVIMLKIAQTKFSDVWKAPPTSSLASAKLREN
jgi:hypothetical protein